MKKLFYAKRTAIVLAVALILTCFASTLPADAASTPDLKKANVKWDLQNNKTVKFKTTWSYLGTKTHTVRMTGYKVSNSRKKGYKQCTFTLTVNRKIKPTRTSGRINVLLRHLIRYNSDFNALVNIYPPLIPYGRRVSYPLP